MHEIYLVCLGLGAIVLVVQVALDLLGIGDVHGSMGDGLDLLSVRSVAAGTTLFGAIGLWLSSRGWPVLATAPVSVLAGLGAAVATAFVTRQLVRLESDGSLRLENAVGQAGTVYLTVPPRGEGAGRVQFALQGRTVELRAVSEEPAAIPTGAAVVVVSVVDAGTVEVTPTPQLEGIDT